MPQALDCLGGHAVVWDVRFEIPHDADPSFAARDNEVRWSVALTIDAKGAPAWSEDAVFVVRPRRVIAAP